MSSASQALTSFGRACASRLHTIFAPMMGLDDASRLQAVQEKIQILTFNINEAKAQRAKWQSAVFRTIPVLQRIPRNKLDPMISTQLTQLIGRIKECNTQIEVQNTALNACRAKENILRRAIQTRASALLVRQVSDLVDSGVDRYEMQKNENILDANARTTEMQRISLDNLQDVLGNHGDTSDTSNLLSDLGVDTDENDVISMLLRCHGEAPQAEQGATAESASSTAEDDEKNKRVLRELMSVNAPTRIPGAPPPPSALLAYSYNDHATSEHFPLLGNLGVPDSLQWSAVAV